MKFGSMRGLLATIAICFGVATSVGAGAQILIEGVRPGAQPAFYLKNLQVHVKIDGAVAETTVDQTFANETPVAQEGVYLFPLPDGAVPTALSMTADGKTLEAQILKGDEARGTYEAIVRRRRDPALLEYVGRDLIRISLLPVPPGGERTIHMRYTEVVGRMNGMLRYVYPLSTTRFGTRPATATSVDIRLHSDAPIANVYSPTHDLSIRRPDDHTASASWEASNIASDNDLTVLYSTADKDVGLSLLTYQSGDRDGYFMLLASPRVQIPEHKILPKHIVLVLDRTGSMAGPKIKQARRALLYCLNSLHTEDKFDVITFNEQPDLLAPHLESASEEHIAAARKFVENIDASGGTNIDDALDAALKLVWNLPAEQRMVVFMTDGLPTIGETNVDTIIEHVKRWNAGEASSYTGARAACAADADAAHGARIFCFGLGYDVNVPFLDRLASVGRGSADYIKPEEDVEARVSSFFAKVSSPVLSNPKLSFGDASVYDVYPRVLPDLFKDGQLVVTGRYRSAAPTTAVLTGHADGVLERYEKANNSEPAESAGYLPRIWAARKLGYLIDQVRLNSESGARNEVIDEIVRLSKEYGIVTEYTSFLITEAPDQITSVDGVRREILRRSLENGLSGLGVTNQSLRAKQLQDLAQVMSRYQSPSGAVYGFSGGMMGGSGRIVGGGGFAGATGQIGPQGQAATAGMSMTNAPTAGPIGAAGAPGNFANGTYLGATPRVTGNPFANLFGASGASELKVVVQSVEGKTFYLRKNGVWQDASYDDKKQKLVSIKAFSPAHFALMAADKKLGAYSSVGSDVIVRIGNTAVHISGEGRETLTKAEIAAILGP